ncbi:MAG: NACHT domain-containing protein [Cyanobacteria bacterium RI_101]|nr:NACHT domain-containing protein [Cyanobacteria bacterium RI_101]
MTKRSLVASPQGQTRAKNALQRKGWTQDYLAAEAGLSTRNSVWKFLSGRPIDRQIFMELCFQLDLSWEDIAQLPQVPDEEASPEAPAPAPDLKSRLRPWIERQCGALPADLDSARPLPLEKIYTDLCLYERPRHQQWLEVADLQREEPRPDLRPLPALAVLQRHPRAVVLAKPGAGKTSFLKRLALGCYAGDAAALFDRVPFFVSLRRFAQFPALESATALWDYVAEELTPLGATPEEINQTFERGQALILLDALDEVPPSRSAAVLACLQSFADRFYGNAMVITCRLAAQTYRFSGFAYLELADFSAAQTETFIRRWFDLAAPQPELGRQRAVQFLETLDQPDYQGLGELTRTPLLLALLCSVFQERAKFPQKRSRLYQECLEILLGRWDQARGIQRESGEVKLTLVHRLKLLEAIAAETFRRGQYFLEKQELQQMIADFLHTLPQGDPDPESRWLQGETLLQALAAQSGLFVEQAKGIYSFSHLTLQEYLCARQIAARPTPAELEQALEALAQKLDKPRWREVIVLTVELSPQAPILAARLQARVDELFSADFLREIRDNLKTAARARSLPYDPAALEAFYLGLLYIKDLNLAGALDARFYQDLPGELALDQALLRVLTLVKQLARQPELEGILDLGFALDLEGRFTLSPAFSALKNQLPDAGLGLEALLDWWRRQGEDWSQAFQDWLTAERRLPRILDLGPEQRQKLQEYYEIQKFLADCLALLPPHQRPAPVG